MKITHTIEYDEHIITGYIVMLTTNLPVDVDKARKHLACFQAAFDKYDEVMDK